MAVSSFGTNLSNALIAILYIILIPQKFGLRQVMEGCGELRGFSYEEKAHG